MTAPTTAPTTAATTSTWNIDGAHSQVEFAVKHLMISTVRGRFKNVSGTIQINEADWTKSRVDVSIDVDSIETSQAQRDAHLKSADFFDVEKYPTITFTSKRIEAVGEAEFKLIGDLTMHGVTREIVLNATDEGRNKDPWGGERAGFAATAKLNRGDYGLNYNQALETGGVLVGTEIKISLEIQAIKAA